MFIRIVKMGFDPDKTEDFLATFELNQSKIRAFKGCLFLELYRDKEQPHLFFTYSHWSDEQKLEDYRNSELFKKIWAETKVLFNQKPEAWSVDKLVSL